MASLSSERLALLRAALAEKGLSQPCASALPRRADRARAPLSAAQERLFFLELYEPGSALYNDGLLVTLTGALDPERLARAIARVAERHEILRTTFALEGEGPVQRVAAAASIALERVDLAADGDPRAAARDLARRAARRPFDLERAPPWRAALARLGESDWALALTMHHILSDGASMGLFCDELGTAYAADEGPEAPALAVQFGDYAAWEHAQRDESRAARDLSFWRTTLAGGIPACCWSEGVGAASRRGAQVPLHLAAPALARLESLARGAQLTSNHVLLALWFALLGAKSGAQDLCTGIASSLRQRRELEPLIGFFVQSLPLRVDLTGEPAFLALAGKVRVAALAADAHASLPFERILRAAEPAAGPRPAPRAPQTFFAHMKDAIRAPALPGVTAAWEFVDPGVARFELALVLHQSSTGTGLTGFLEYDMGVFAPTTAERLAEDYAALLARVLAEPGVTLASLQESCRTPSRRARAFPTPLRRAAGA